MRKLKAFLTTLKLQFINAPKNNERKESKITIKKLIAFSDSVTFPITGEKKKLSKIDWDKRPDGIEVSVGAATEVIGATSILTGLGLEGKFGTPQRLKAARASKKFSEIRKRK